MTLPTFIVLLEYLSSLLLMAISGDSAPNLLTRRYSFTHSSYIVRVLVRVDIGPQASATPAVLRNA